MHEKYKVNNKIYRFSTTVTSNYKSYFGEINNLCQFKFPIGLFQAFVIDFFIFLIVTFVIVLVPTWRFNWKFFYHFEFLQRYEYTCYILLVQVDPVIIVPEFIQQFVRNLIYGDRSCVVLKLAGEIHTDSKISRAKYPWSLICS